MPLKITSWNVEHAEKLITATPSAAVQERRKRVHDTFKPIDSDIFCLVEGPKSRKRRARSSAARCSRYADEILKVPASKNPLLLNHILLSQPLCDAKFPYVAAARGGAVEHQAFEVNNTGVMSTASKRTSDHRPVSFTFVDRA